MKFVSSPPITHNRSRIMRPTRCQLRYCRSPHFSSRFVVRATAALGCAPAGLDLRNYSLQPRPGSPALGCTVCFALQCSRFGEMRIKLVAGTAWHASAMPSTQQQPTQH